MKYIKQRTHSSTDFDRGVTSKVKGMLAKIAIDSESAVREYAAQFDDWHEEFILSKEKRARLIAGVPEQTKLDIQFAHQQIKTFAQAQLASISEFNETI